MPGQAVGELKFRRRRESVTNYAKRLALVKGGIERVAVRKSNKRITGQVIRYNEKGDVVLASADSNELKKLGWPSRRNRSTAYLTGMLLASKMKEKGRECVLDLGLSSPVKNSISFVFAKGCVDNGLKIRGKFDIDEAYYSYSNIAKYAAGLKEANAFGLYRKNNIKVENMPQLFNEVKEKIRNMRK